MNALYIARSKQNEGVEEGAWYLAWLPFRIRLAMLRGQGPFFDGRDGNCIAIVVY